jgi:hypothetical protein
MSDLKDTLPVIQNDDQSELAACSPKIYVSAEEAALLALMRQLRGRSTELKAKLGQAGETEAKEIQSAIDALREEWNELSARREKAYIRKMITLGHLPPTADPGP